MQFISSHQGKLQNLIAGDLVSKKTRTFTTGLGAIDNLLPARAFPCSAIHEILTPPGQGLPFFFTTLLARCALSSDRPTALSPPRPFAHSPIRFLLWSDPHRLLYPPALAAAGIPLDHLLLLRPGNDADEKWAVAECLRCPGVGVTVGCFGRLSRIEARRFQLAAESGGGVGFLLRPAGAISSEYAAATRWLIQSIPGERTVQRWQLQLIHGHGGRVGKNVILEACRESNHVRAFEAVGGGSGEEAVAKRA